MITSGKRPTFIWLLCFSLSVLLFMVPGDIEAAALTPDLNINWDNRHTLDELEFLLMSIADEYGDIASLYPIGHSYQEHQIWCLELTRSGHRSDKTGIAIFGNIHGGEQESGECAAYTAWWLATHYGEDAVATEILDNYIIYVVPIINPDGYAQSFILNNRGNLRPTDRNGVKGTFSDPYTDINGDGFIAYVYQGDQESTIDDRDKIGMESPDWDGNGVFGDDPRTSNIDLNRNFDYMWNRFDIDRNPIIGANAIASAGPGPASEPEVLAVQNFLITHPVHALASLHTGLQCVLWPWCYQAADTADHRFMKSVAADMAREFTATTGRDCYSKQSYDDYPTAAELIDWSYGRLGIHSYTLEVYAGGLPNPAADAGDAARCTWGNELPADQWIYAGHWQGEDDIWLLNTSRAQMAGIAPPEQSLMAQGAKNALLKMILSEPKGPGPMIPDYLLWSLPMQ